MLHVQRSILRTLPSPSSISSIASRNTRSFVSIAIRPQIDDSLTSLSRPQRAAKLLYTFRRSFADNGSLKQSVPNDKEASNDNASTIAELGQETTQRAAESTSENVYPVAGDSQRDIARETLQPQSGAESISEVAKETIGSLKQTATSAVGKAIDAGRSFTSEGPPGPELYLGNLYFDIDENRLAEAFKRFGKIVRTKIAKDPRGLSKGFGYLEFENEAAATEMRNELHGQIFEGRRLVVQYSATSRRHKRGESFAPDPAFRNPPAKTLYVGNMSYEMSDKDLNDLFRPIKNVVDVRVAIDRRTGQPRGFAHADFLDVKSAEAAAEYLQSQQFYGRTLRIDFAATGVRGEQ